MRQAVVLIHGIGEQKPMETLRPFTRALLQGTEKKYYSKPDSMSELFDLRCLRSTSAYNTDFYEYYWAYHIQGTKIWDVLLWILGLVTKAKINVPDGLRGLWTSTRFLLFLLVLLLLFGGWAAAADWFKNQPQYGLVWFVTTVALMSIQYFLVYYLGDAARYLSRRPKNIQLRHKILSDGLKLLRTLQDSRKYDRIILVGHSLGSVIAYDLITHFWQENNETLSRLGVDPEVNGDIRRRMQSRSSPQPMVRDELSRVGEELVKLGAERAPKLVDQFQQAQVDAWKEQRYYGNPWCITDLVTLGSPLAHSMFLLASDRKDFDMRMQDRELVTCPPQRDRKGYAYSGRPVNVGPEGDNQSMKYTPLILHHAAPFSVTRWTNLFFPVYLGVFGDFVGGEVGPALGWGVKDVSVSTKRFNGTAKYSLLSHVSYWYHGDQISAADSNEFRNVPALSALVQALSLRDLKKFVPTGPRD